MIHPHDEEWRSVVGHEGQYEVSSLGRIRSVSRWVNNPGGGKRYIRGRIRKAPPNSWGYPTVALATGKGSIAVHRAVVEAFRGPIPQGMQVRHLDGNPANNVLPNLVAGTPSENMADCLEHGTHPKARKTRCRNGHPYNEKNTSKYSDGSRRCLICHRESERTRRAERGLRRTTP